MALLTTSATYQTIPPHRHISKVAYEMLGIKHLCCTTQIAREVMYACATCLNKKPEDGGQQV